jgi:hypothetical protein
MNMHCVFRASIVFLCISLGVAEETPRKMESLTTNDGKTYNAVTVREVTPAGIRIMHSAGAATLPFENLPKEVQDQLGGFDTEKAVAYRQAEARRADENAERMNAEHAARVAERNAKLDAQVDLETSERGVVKVLSVTSEGALCMVAWEVDVVVKTPRKDAFGRQHYDISTKKGLSTFSKSPIFVYGLGGVVDDSTVAVAIKRMAAAYSYKSAGGAAKTVSAYKLIAKG